MKKILKNLFLACVFLCISPIAVFMWFIVILIGGTKSLGMVFIKTGCHWIKPSVANKIQSAIAHDEFMQILKDYSA